MSKYKILNIGCDDETEGVFILSEAQYNFLHNLFEKLNKHSSYGCQPKIYIEKIIDYPTEKGGEG